MNVLLLVAALVLFIIAAVLLFGLVGTVTVTTCLGLAATGLACWVASVLVPAFTGRVQ